MMIAVITYGTALFALMISQWRGETVSVSVSVKEREKKKKFHEFLSPSGFIRCVCDGRVCFASLWPDMHRKSVFAFGKLESSTFSVSHV